MKIVIAFLAAFAASLALAGAEVTKDGGCTGFVPSDTLDGQPWLETLFTTETQGVVTPSGNTKLTCQFDHGTPIKHANSARGFLCNTYLGLTNESKMTASPGGKATLTCWIKANQ